MLVSLQSLILTLCVLMPTPYVARPQSDQAYELWKEGRRAWYRENWEEAAKHFRDLITNYPDSVHRVKSKNYLGYCLYNLELKEEAFEIFQELIDNPETKSEIKIDAKAKLLQIAYDLAARDESMRNVLVDYLKDTNPDIRFYAALWLSKLDDRRAVPIFFDIIKTENDVDRRDTAAKHVLKLGTEQEKERLQNILDSRKQATSGQTARMVKLIYRNLDTGEESVKINLPISLFNVLLKTLSEEQLGLFEKQAGVDLRNIDQELEGMPAGTTLFKVVDQDNTEIKVYLE